MASKGLADADLPMNLTKASSGSAAEQGQPQPSGLGEHQDLHVASPRASNY